MLISGGKKGSDGTPFRVVTGRGAFVIPIFRHGNLLTLAMQEALIEDTCVTQQGIAIKAKAVCAFKVANDAESIVNAAQRFLSDQNQMSVLTGRIFAGHLRSIIGSMTVEQIVRERQTLAAEVLEASKVEMAKLGLLVDSFQISSIDDMGSGYIAAMAAPHNAAIQQGAKIAEAEANRASAEAEQESARKQAEYARQTAVVEATYKAEVDKAQAEAAQAGPLARAEAQRAVTQSETELAQKQAALRQQQLVAEIIKPAEAESERIRLVAKANADATRVQAEAAATNDRVSLDQILIEQLPTIVEKAAGGLAHANINLLDGADGMANIVTGLMSQGRAIFETARVGNNSNGNGAVAAPAQVQGPPETGENSSEGRADESSTHPNAAL